MIADLPPPPAANPAAAVEPPAPAPRSPGQGAPAAEWRLCLVVAGGSGRSRGAIQNLAAFCATHLPGRCEVEVVDIYLHPERAALHNVVAAPTLIRLAPLPVRRIVGDLSHEPSVLRGLELT